MGEKKSKRIKIEVCVGSNCAEQKSKKVARRLKECIEEREAEDKVHVKKCDCMKRCKKGPLVTIPSKDLVFNEVKPGDAERILESILEAD